MSSLEVGIVSPSTELLRALRSEQYAGLLAVLPLLPLPQPAAAISATVATSTAAVVRRLLV